MKMCILICALSWELRWGGICRNSWNTDNAGNLFNQINAGMESEGIGFQNLTVEIITSLHMFCIP